MTHGVRRRRTTSVEAGSWLLALILVAAGTVLSLLQRFSLVGAGGSQLIDVLAAAVNMGAAIYVAYQAIAGVERLLAGRTAGGRGHFDSSIGTGQKGVGDAQGRVQTSRRSALAALRSPWRLISALVASIAVLAAGAFAWVALSSVFGSGNVSPGIDWLAGGTGAAFLGLGVLATPLLCLVAFVFLYFGYRRLLSEMTQTQLSGWVFMMPALMLLLLWVYLPAANALWISLFRDFNYLGDATFVGLRNYFIAFRDPIFIRSLVNTLWFVVGTVPISILLGIFIAILLNEPIRARAFFRLTYFLPYITALTAAAAVWMWIYNPGFGLLNYALGLQNFRWLSNPTGIFALALQPFGISLSGYAAGPSVALVSIMIMSIWSFLGYNVVIFLAGLQSISKEYYEAARIDGANWWQQMRWITWPLLAPTTFFVLIISLIGSLNVFTQILIMTPTGGVLNDTISVVMYLYQKGFRDFDFGYASALAFILFIVTMVLTLLQRRMFASRGGNTAEA